MSSDDLRKQWYLSYLSGSNMSYVDGLYEDYIQNPDAVSADWRACFQALPAVNGEAQEVSHQAVREYFLKNAQKRNTNNSGKADKQADVTRYIDAFRMMGHQAATLDPLAMAPRSPLQALQPEYYQLGADDKHDYFSAGSDFSSELMTLDAITQAVHDTYCGNIGIEYMHIGDPAEVNWFKEKMESSRGHSSISAEKKRKVLADLIATDGLERYLATRYVGQKRFSVEGADALIPMLNEIIQLSGHAGVKETLVGMAHRGRLNAMINVFGKAPKELFSEFEGKENHERTGDVKYHLGFSANLRTDSGAVVRAMLAFNPSHLEIIGPVVEGAVRSRLRRLDDLVEKNQVLPVIIHGDAAFAGQGVVMETFNFSQARGYCTGGTLHIVTNNQIGFTTSDPADARSTLYCTDIAKMVQAPVLHVNGDDPEAVIFATQIAFEYRMKFKRDIVIDVVCYRRNGHNEADEPSITQPLMYQKIKQMRPLREIYADKLLQEGIVTQADIDQQIEAYRDKLDNNQIIVATADDYRVQVEEDWSDYVGAKWTDLVDTAVAEKILDELSEKLLTLPAGFTLHPVVKKIMEDREKMTLGELPLNWGYAETMAYATLLHQGFHVRLSGQDCQRGTFAHRHAVLHDQKTGVTHTPLDQVVISPSKPFSVIDSVLSEEAVLAFEYGYASSEPSTLTLWEAQFGDFANGAQVVIDQFISSGEQKWGHLCGLVMLLPHGYEGQGPEHSSARLERYMQLCAQQNIQVCVPTTPAQMFHLLRRQLLRKFRKPLIVMTPKSLLRHKLAVSKKMDLVKGAFQVVIPEVDAIDVQKVTRLILCSGKVYYDLLQKRRDDNLSHVAIVRIEQLYPFPKKALRQLLTAYAHVKKIIWCQEEPQNQGVWFSSQHNILDCLGVDQTLSYAGRDFAAAPAVGSMYLHVRQQAVLIEQALVEDN